MNRHAFKLRNSVQQACHRQDFPYRTVLHEYGFTDVLDTANRQNLGPKELAVLALSTCCHDHDGDWNNCIAFVMGVTQFLLDAVGDPGTQALRDLVNILKSNGGPSAVQRWMESQRFQ